MLEHLARSLNAVVLERKFIQNEIARDAEGKPIKVENEKGNGSSLLVALEPSLLGDGKEHFQDSDYHTRENHKDEEKDLKEFFEKQPKADKNKGVFTRCELTIQRVETHLLDPSPISTSSKQKESGKTAGKSKQANGGGNGESHRRCRK